MARRRRDDGRARIANARGPTIDQRCTITSTYLSWLLLLERSSRLLEKAAVEGGRLVSTPLGLCYAFSEWEDADGMICEPGGKRRKADLTPEELAEAVATQAAEVRRLKEEEGRENKDPAVVAAVAELLRLKAQQEAVSST